MATFLGLQDTTSFDANRFTNWRRTILYLFPNGSAPLTALLSLTKGEETNDPKFNWNEEVLATQRTTLSAAYLVGATTINIDDAFTFRPGHLILNELTDEIMKVMAVDATGLIIDVQRSTVGTWGAAAASSGANDALIIIGNANPEGASPPPSLFIAPEDVFNYTQIFRTPWDMTGTAAKTSLIYSRTGPYVEKMRQSLSHHSIEMEKGFIRSRRAQYTNATTGKVERTTGGLLEWIPAANEIDLTAGNTFGLGNAASTLTIKVMDAIMELAFRFSLSKVNQKFALCGSGFLASLNTAMQGTGRIDLVPAEDTFGIDVTRYVSPHGTLFLNSHPLFTQHPIWRYQALILDIGGLHYRYLTGRDTAKLTNRQAPGDDLRRDEWLTECGLEVHHGEVNVFVDDAALGA
jgi:hypothetical protein